MDEGHDLSDSGGPATHPHQAAARAAEQRIRLQRFSDYRRRTLTHTAFVAGRALALPR